jgi:hypothetical protein
MLTFRDATSPSSGTEELVGPDSSLGLLPGTRVVVVVVGVLWAVFKGASRRQLNRMLTQ